MSPLRLSLFARQVQMHAFHLLPAAMGRDLPALIPACAEFRSHPRAQSPLTSSCRPQTGEVLMQNPRPF